jgi:hypothetical protein
MKRTYLGWPPLGHGMHHTYIEYTNDLSIIAFDCLINIFFVCVIYAWDIPYQKSTIAMQEVEKPGNPKSRKIQDA